MYAKIVAVLALVGFTVASPTTSPAPPFAGVDPNTLQCDPKGQVFLLLPHFSDCHKFYMCDNGIEKLFTCPSDLIFDFELQTCNYKWATECVLRNSDNEGSGDEIDGSGDDPSEFWAQEEFETFDLQQEAENEETESKSEFQSMLNCHKSINASKRIPYKGDCQRYWHCVSGTLKTDYCSDGLFFNALTQQCDFEANVKCEQQIVNELEGEYIEYKK